jgi:multiple sugar transport system ATP-binding protein
MVVMNRGTIQQIGKPIDIYNEPKNIFVAGFLGSPAMNLFEATLICSGAEIHLDSGELRLAIKTEITDNLRKHSGERVTVGIRPEHIAVFEYDFPGLCRIPTPVEIMAIELTGSEKILHLTSGKTRLVARVGPRTKAAIGDIVQITIDPKMIRIFDSQTGEALPN